MIKSKTGIFFRLNTPLEKSKKSRAKFQKFDNEMHLQQLDLRQAEFAEYQKKLQTRVPIALRLVQTYKALMTKHQH